MANGRFSKSISKRTGLRSATVYRRSCRWSTFITTPPSLKLCATAYSFRANAWTFCSCSQSASGSSSRSTGNTTFPKTKTLVEGLRRYGSSRSEPGGDQHTDQSIAAAGSHAGRHSHPRTPQAGAFAATRISSMRIGRNTLFACHAGVYSRRRQPTANEPRDAHKIKQRNSGTMISRKILALEGDAPAWRGLTDRC
jgi:hypothetical protein